MQRKLRRNDVVIQWDGGMYGRVWRRIDVEHVQVIDCGCNVRIYHESKLELTNYKGKFDPRWDKHFRHMPRLRRLKKIAMRFNAHFGGRNDWGGRWTKLERQTALNDHEAFSR